ncbi:MAG: MFS transporter [Acetobacteraceae bacterium]|nr:MFS transporter [Acetobacteraceae bacterium]
MADLVLPASGLQSAQRGWAMLTICLGVVLAGLDGAIANIALPTIANDLHITPAASVWVVNAYQLAVAVCLLPLASWGESVGYKPIYWTGLAVFTLASLGCALSRSLPVLVLSRVVQGLSGGCMASVSAALIRFIYPPAQFGRGMGLLALAVALSAALGPTIGAAVLSVANWPWLFAINVPIGVVAVLVGARVLPSTPRQSRTFDAAGSILSALTVGLLIIGLDDLGHGASPSALTEIGAGVAAGTGLILHQLPRGTPLVPIDLFRIPLFALSALTSICSYAAQMLAFVSLPFFFQHGLGRTQVQTGLLMTPWPVAVAIVAPIAGRLTDRYPAGILGSAGLAVMATGLGLMVALPAHPADADIAWRMCICGCGFGFFQTPNNRAMMTSGPKERSGAASGMLATARLTGQSTGAALVAAMFGLFPSAATTASLTAGAAFAATAGLFSCLRLGRS